MWSSNTQHYSKIILYGIRAGYSWQRNKKNVFHQGPIVPDGPLCLSPVFRQPVFTFQWTFLLIALPLMALSPFPATFPAATAVVTLTTFPANDHRIRCVLGWSVQIQSPLLKRTKKLLQSFGNKTSTITDYRRILQSSVKLLSTSREDFQKTGDQIIWMNS